jgi:hypothetical protein
LIADIQGSSDYARHKEVVEKQIAASLKEVSCSLTTGRIDRNGGTIGVYAGNNALGHIDLVYAPYVVRWRASGSGPSGRRTVVGIARRRASFDETYVFVFDPNRPIVTLFTDIIPSWIAGPGTPFRITGSFTDIVWARVEQCCP